MLPGRFYCRTVLTAYSMTDNLLALRVPAVPWSARPQQSQIYTKRRGKQSYPFEDDFKLYASCFLTIFIFTLPITAQALFCFKVI